MIYRFENNIIEWDGKAKVFSDGWLVFKGDGYIGILTFLRLCNNHPDAVAKFKPQLEQREKARFEKPLSNNNRKEKP